MACTLTGIPGFELTRSEELLATYRPKLTDLLTRLMGQKEATAFLRSPRVAVYGTREAFPDGVREVCFASSLPRYTVYYMPTDLVYIAANGVDKPGFIPELLAEVAVVPYLGSLAYTKSYDAGWDVFIKKTDMAQFLSRINFRNAFDPNGIHNRNRQAFVQALSPWEETLFSVRKDSKHPIYKLLKFALKNAADFIRQSPEPFIKKHYRHSKSIAECSLSSVVSIAPFSLPSPKEIFGDQADTILTNDRFQEAFTTPKLPRIPGHLPAWTTSPDDTFPFDDTKTVRPIADLSLRPFARLQSRMVYPENLEPINAVRTFSADFPQNELEVGVTLPFVKNTMYTISQITRVQVSPNLNWAVLSLLPQEAKHPIRALSATWGMQAERLKTGFRYSASLSFWASAINLEVPKRFTYGSSEKFPILTVPAVFDRRLDKCTFSGVDYILMRCCIRQDTVTVVIPKSALPKGRIKKGQTVALTGFYTVGELREASFDSNAFDAFSLDSNHFRANRTIPRFQFSNPGIGLFHQALTIRPTSERLRKTRLRLMYDAAHHDYMPACGQLGISLFRVSAEHIQAEAFAAQLLGKAAAHEYVPAIRFLVLSPKTEHFVPRDIRWALTELLAKRFNDSDAQLAYYRYLQSKTDKTDERNLAWLVQSAAGGNMKALYALARAHALGIGATKNSDLTRGLILSALTRGVECAKYWAAGLACLGERFFTLSTPEIETSLKQFAQNGLPANILLLGLFYQYGKTGNPKAPLIAFCLFSWVEHTLHDEEARHLRESAQSELTADLIEQMPIFNVWEELNIPSPPESRPISSLTAPLETGPINLHPFFLEQLDPTIRTTSDVVPSERLMRQLAFMAENSRPVRLGLLRDNPRPVDAVVRLTGHGVDTDCTTIDRSMLLVTAIRVDDGQPWDVAGVYPIFQDGTHVPVYLHGAAQSEQGVCALLGITPFSDTRGPMSSLLAFDPLWPDQHSLYRTNERYKAVLYGLTDRIRRPGPDFFDAIPPDVIQKLREANTDVRSAKSLVGFSPVDVTNALYRISSTIRAVDSDYTQVFSIPYTKVHVDSFLSKDYSAEPFVLYVPKELFLKEGLKVGDRIQATFELSVCIDSVETKPKVTLN